jgi:glycosyltransferase involved in cell wall biosynthesis
LKIILVGPLPPPLGGISVHLSRFNNYLQDNSVSTQVFNTSLKSKNVQELFFKFFNILKNLKRSKENDLIIHVHSHNVFLRLLFLIICKFYKVFYVITVHSYDTRNNKFSFINEYIFKNSDFIVTVNSRIKNMILKKGINNSNIQVIPAFISPMYEKDNEALSEEEKIIANRITKGSPLILGNAYRYDFINEIDLYGIDISIETCKLLKNKYSNILFCFFISQIDNIEYHSKIIQMIEINSLKDNFIIIDGNKPFYKFLKFANIFIRPTITDGDALSIREALALGIPVIASDCVYRPQNVITFKSRDIQDFCRTIENTLENIECISEQICACEQHSYEKEVLDCYIDLINRRKKNK